MMIQWHLLADRQKAQWTVQSEDLTIRWEQQLDLFFALVESLNDDCTKVKAHMESGMDPAAAIAEWQRLIEGGSHRQKSSD